MLIYVLDLFDGGLKPPKLLLPILKGKSAPK
jgi:hypothetical protein